MKVECLLLDGLLYNLGDKIVTEFHDINSSVKSGQQFLRSISINSILNFLNIFSRSLLKEEEVKHLDGIAFLSNWLRKSNLEKLIINNLGSIDILNQFLGLGSKRVKAQPKGVVCQWIAGNIPTLSLFSLFQSLLVRNANVLRIPKQSIQATMSLLRLFSTLEVDGITGKELLKSVSIVYFSSLDTNANNALSMIADIRVVWGGSSAVQAIQGLSHRDHCEDIIFGPKYSFSVLDSKALQSDKLDTYIRRFATDIVAFEQSACSSPHVFFIETDFSNKSFIYVKEKFGEELSRLMKISPKQAINQLTATQIIRKRAEYGLSLDKDFLCPKENDWTILIDKNVTLEEPIQSRTIWLKSVSSLLDIPELITKKIQTIGCVILDETKFLEFVNEVTFRGVARCVPPGQMNIYDSPWDGVFFLQRLVNFSSIIKI